jgi:hypothetical protein
MTEVRCAGLLAILGQQLYFLPGPKSDSVENAWADSEIMSEIPAVAHSSRILWTPAYRISPYTWYGPARCGSWAGNEVRSLLPSCHASSSSNL